MSILKAVEKAIAEVNAAQGDVEMVKDITRAINLLAYTRDRVAADRPDLLNSNEIADQIGSGVRRVWKIWAKQGIDAAKATAHKLVDDLVRGIGQLNKCAANTFAGEVFREVAEERLTWPALASSAQNKYGENEQREIVAQLSLGSRCEHPVTMEREDGRKIWADSKLNRSIVWYVERLQHHLRKGKRTPFFTRSGGPFAWRGSPYSPNLDLPPLDASVASFEAWSETIARLIRYDAEIEAVNVSLDEGRSVVDGFDWPGENALDWRVHIPGISQNKTKSAMTDLRDKIENQFLRKYVLSYTK